MNEIDARKILEFLNSQGIMFNKRVRDGTWVSQPSCFTQGFEGLRPSNDEYALGYMGATASPFPPSKVLVKPPGDPTDLTQYVLALMPYVLFEKWRHDRTFMGSGYPFYDLQR